MVVLLFRKGKTKGLRGHGFTQKLPDNEEMAFDQMKPLLGHRNLPGKKSRPLLHPSISGRRSQLDMSSGKKGRQPGFEESLEVEDGGIGLLPHTPHEVPQNSYGLSVSPVFYRPGIVPSPKEKDLAKGRMAQKKIGAPVFDQPVDREVWPGPLESLDRGKGEDHIPDSPEEDNQDGTSGRQGGRERSHGLRRGGELFRVRLGMELISVWMHQGILAYPEEREGRVLVQLHRNTPDEGVTVPCHKDLLPPSRPFGQFPNWALASAVFTEALLLLLSEISRNDHFLRKGSRIIVSIQDPPSSHGFSLSPGRRGKDRSSMNLSGFR